MIRVKLQKNRDLRSAVFYWKEMLPFVENKRAILIHRPRRATTYNLGPKWGPHVAINYWCGATQTGRDNFVFHSDPPKQKLVCNVCETRAVMAGQLTSDELAGRHVHKGRLKAIQYCCAEGQE